MDPQLQKLNNQIQDLQANKVWNGMSPDTRQNIGDCVIDSVMEDPIWTGKFIFKNKIYPFPLYNSSGAVVFTNLTVPGNVTIGGTLGVTGVTTVATLNGANGLFSNIVRGNALQVNGTGGLGYISGSGGTVTQGTNRTTAVTLNKYTGQIITANTPNINAGATATFTVNNTTIGATDTVILTIASTPASPFTQVYIQNIVDVTSFQIVVTNASTTTAETTALTINYAIIRASLN